MYRLVVRIGDQFVNIACDTIETDGTTVKAYRDGNLVGMFLIGSFDCLYLAERSER